MRCCNIIFVTLLLSISLVECQNNFLQSFPITRYDLIKTSKNISSVFRVGLMGYVVNNDTSHSITRFSVEHLNNDMSVLPGVNLQLYYVGTDGTKAQALQAAESLIAQYNVKAIIGARTSDESDISNIVASIFKVPQINALNGSPSLSNKKLYPYFLRTIPPAQYQNTALRNLIRFYGWKQIYVIYSNDLYGVGGFSDLQVQLGTDNVQFYSTQITGGSSNYSSLIATLNNTISQTRMRIFVIYTQAADGLTILKQLNDAGMMGSASNNAFILTNAIGVAFQMRQRDIAAYPFLQGTITLTARAAVAGSLLDSLNTEWRNANATLFPGSRSNPIQEWYFYDAVYTIANALDSLVKLKPLENITGQELLTSMLASNFTGVTGVVNYDANSDRIGDYVWFNVRDTYDNTFSQFSAVYSAISKATVMSTSYPLSFNGKAKQPDGICPCFNGVCDNLDVCHCKSGWEGSSCNIYNKPGGFDTKGYVLVTIIPTLIFVVLLVVAIQIVRRKRRALIKDMAQKQRSVIKRSDIVLQNRIGRGASGEVFKGMFRGTEVAVKKVTTSVNSVITEQFEMECAIMTALRHPNIVMFMGMCLVPEQGELLLVMELMEKGSLHDIIHNAHSKIQFTQTLCLHIAYQAAKGMNFLHQSDPPIIHCDLKSHNILMDDKWNARISDFGITKFKKLKEKKDKVAIKGANSYNSIGTIYWAAPEIFLGEKHSEASDCYSFGVVLWELYHREVPYGGKEPMLVATEVQNGARPIMKDDVDPNIKTLITDCWAQDPALRPTFETIMNRLRSITSSNPVETFDAQARANIEAPTGTVYLVATEVSNAKELWDAVPMEMCEAMKMHNQFIRQKLEAVDGYEVECNLYGFLVAFRNTKTAVDFCMRVQTELLTLQWPKALLDHQAASVQKEGSTLLYSGLRVRMAIHAGVPNCHTDALGRMKYVGPVADKTKKLLSDASSCGILATNIVIEHATSKGVRFVEEPTITPLGEVVESPRGGQSGRNKAEKIFDVLPKSLQGRKNLVTLTETDTGIPNAVVVDMGPKVRSKKFYNEKSNYPTWVALVSDLTEKEQIGKGAIGDYIRSLWKGREILQKVLMNQQISEKDVLVLQAHASVLVKLQHKNLLPFYGVCLEPDHISLLIQYMPKSQNLNALLKDNTVQLSLQAKVKIAKQIAEGMAYLTSQSQHKWLTMFANLKSGNVMVEKDTMNVKITDFGQGNLKDLARTMTSIGTVAWTAPELLNDEETTPKIAQYSFGIIMWEIYTRAFPYADEHPIKVVTKIVAGHRPAIPVGCPPKYKELMVQCWDNDPNQRPTWGEVIAVLSEL